jgi:hypothetical protein
MLQLIVSDRVFHGCDKFNSFVGDIIFVSKRMLKLVSRPEYILNHQCALSTFSLFFFSIMGIESLRCMWFMHTFFFLYWFIWKSKIGSSVIIFARQVINSLAGTSFQIHEWSTLPEAKCVMVKRYINIWHDTWSSSFGPPIVAFQFVNRQFRWEHS